MKRNRLDELVVRVVAGIVAVIIVMVPFHAFLTVWLSSGLGHYTALRLWKEFLLMPAGLGTLYLLYRSPRLRQQLIGSWLWRLIAAYVLVNLIWGIVARAHGAVTTKALLYGELVDLRLFAILLIAWVAAAHTGWLHRYWQRLLLMPAVFVVAIGLLQRFVLPYDVMKHFGYNAQTIYPYETIDHKTSYIRIRSTLRGANLLGGYMVIVLSERFLMLRRARWRALTALTILAALIVLFASGSRGAWAGLIVSLACLAWLQITSHHARRLALMAGACLLVLVAAAVITLRHNDFVENTAFHTDEHSTSSVSSNAAHYSASLDAAKQVLHEPLGRGPGTAGPAGEYNTGHPERIAENYFLQIGQETGWLGLGLFLAIYVLIAIRLWQRRQDNLAQVLLAAMAGLTVLAMLMHLWTDDTIAYLFWALTGIALAHESLSIRLSEVRPLKSKTTQNNRGVKSREKSIGAAGADV